MKEMFITVIAIVLLAVPASGASQERVASAPSPTGAVCMSSMKDVFEPARPTLRRVVLTTVDGKRETREYIVNQAFKHFPDGIRMILMIREPAEWSGSTYLYVEKNNVITMWAYLAGFQRVREYVNTAETQPYDAFLDSSFTNADIGLIPLPQVCELTETTNYDGIKAYRVEERMAKQSNPFVNFYSRITTWIAAASFFPLHRDYYDPAGRLWKTLSFNEYVRIDKTTVPLLIRMKDLQKNSYSDFRITNVINDIAIPDELFDPKQLAQVSASPLWKSLTAPLEASGAK